jgi:hypothetical protein
MRNVSKNLIGYIKGIDYLEERRRWADMLKQMSVCEIVD